MKVEIKRQNHEVSGSTVSIHQKILDRIVRMTDKFGEGKTQTLIPFFSIIRRSRPTPFNQAVLTPSFCLVIQGSKKIHLGQEVIQYYGGDFVASLIDMPTAGHIVQATRDLPYVGFRIDFTTKEIADVMTEAEINVKPRDKKLNAAAFVGKSDGDILEIFIKLLKLLDKPEEAPFVSTLLKREMIFRLLRGKYGHLFFQQVLFDKKTDGVGKVIEWIKNNYTISFTVDELAKVNNMSVSALHQKFKAITTMGPLQYQKQLRLQEARLLILSGTRDVTTAALEVGYESPSQFSREYRRVFGLPPLQDIKALRENFPNAGAQKVF